MLKRLVSILMALTLVMTIMPTVYAASTDYYYYDFNDYTGWNTKSGVGATDTTIGSDAMILETTNMNRTAAQGLGGKAANDIAAKATVTSTTAQCKLIVGPYATSSNSNNTFKNIQWGQYGNVSGKPYATAQFDVYDATVNGYFKLFGQADGWNSSSRAWEYTVPAVTKNTWHTLAIEFYKASSSSTTYIMNIYVDDKLVSTDTKTTEIWMRKPYLECIAPSGSATSEFFAVDNYRIYIGEYEGKPYYTNTFDDDPAYSYDGGALEIGPKRREKMAGLYGKSTTDNSTAFVYDGSTTEAETPYIYYLSNNVKYDGVTTMEISYLDTTGVAEPKVETNYYKEDGSSTASVVLNYTYAENALAFTLGGNPLNDENGYTRKFARRACWNEFAITYDAPNNTITWYFNGELLATKTIENLGYTYKVKFGTTVPTGATGIVAFDDLKVYKGAYDAAANNTAVTTTDEGIILRDKVINVFSASAVSPDALKAKLSLPGTAAVYADMAAFSDGTVSTTNISDGNILVSISENGEQFELYTINLVNSNDKFSIAEPVISFEDDWSTIAATADFINYTDAEKEYMLVFAVYENGELAYVKADSAKLSFGEAELKVVDGGYVGESETDVEMKIMLWNKSTMAPEYDYLDYSDVENAIE